MKIPSGVCCSEPSEGDETIFHSKPSRRRKSWPLQSDFDDLIDTDSIINEEDLPGKLDPIKEEEATNDENKKNITLDEKKVGTKGKRRRPQPRFDNNEDDPSSFGGASAITIATGAAVGAAAAVAAGAIAGASGAAAAAASAIRKRRIASIFQHYYPEGGWGYVILACASICQLLSHGLQLSFGVLAFFAQRRFQVEGGIVELGRKFIHTLLLTPYTGWMEGCYVCSYYFFPFSPLSSVSSQKARSKALIFRDGVESRVSNYFCSVTDRPPD